MSVVVSAGTIGDLLSRSSLACRLPLAIAHFRFGVPYKSSVAYTVRHLSGRCCNTAVDAMRRRPMPREKFRDFAAERSEIEPDARAFNFMAFLMLFADLFCKGESHDFI